MSTVEIILLLLGIILFIASFVIPEKQKKLSVEDKKFGENQIREILEKEMLPVKEQIQDIIEETVTYSVEKTERSLERLSNEKIMAVNEYSDTVLGEINKNHKEVMFLYDMLNDKQEYLYKAVQEIETVAKKAEKSLKEAEEKTNLRSSMDSVKLEVNEEVEESNQGGLITDTPKKVTGKITTKKKPVVEKNKAEEKRLENMFKPLTPEKILTDIPLIMGSETGKNNNEKILQLHKAGKSNMAIAKELGLGVGEVKLVIDLFQGM